MATITLNVNINTWSPEIVKGDYKHIELECTEVNSQYPQTYKVQVRSQNYDKVNQHLKQNAVLSLKCNLSGRNWTNPEGKTMNFIGLDCFGVAEQPAQSAPPVNAPVVNNTPAPSNTPAPPANNAPLDPPF